MIYIIDFGAGNLLSAWHAFEACPNPCSIISSPNQICEKPSGFVLPGDGSFAYAAEEIRKRGFESLLHETTLPILGICVGYQLLFDFSDEDGGAKGLGLLKGQVKKFVSEDKKIPHMGWNQCKITKPSPILEGVEDNNFFYFVHSFYPTQVEKEVVLLETDYTEIFTAGVAHKNIYGFQFHPEKSHKAGRKIIENFSNLCSQS